MIAYTYVYKLETTTKTNQNMVIKPIANSMYAMQSMNKIERHGHT